MCVGGTGLISAVATTAGINCVVHVCNWACKKTCFMHRYIHSCILHTYVCFAFSLRCGVYDRSSSLHLASTGAACHLPGHFRSAGSRRKMGQIGHRRPQTTGVESERQTETPDDQPNGACRTPPLGVCGLRRHVRNVNSLWVGSVNPVRPV